MILKIIHKIKGTNIIKKLIVTILHNYYSLNKCTTTFINSNRSKELAIMLQMFILIYSNIINALAKIKLFYICNNSRQTTLIPLIQALLITYKLWAFWHKINLCSQIMELAKTSWETQIIYLTVKCIQKLMVILISTNYHFHL